MDLTLGEELFTEIITWRHNNGFHFSPKGKNVCSTDNCAWGVKSYTHFVFESLMTRIRSNWFFGWEGCAEEVHIQGLKGCLQFFDKSPPHSALEFPTGLIPPQKPFILDLLSVETLFSERRNCIHSHGNMFYINIYGVLSEEFKLFDA